MNNVAQYTFSDVRLFCPGMREFVYKLCPHLRKRRLLQVFIPERFYHIPDKPEVLFYELIIKNGVYSYLEKAQDYNNNY